MGIDIDAVVVVPDHRVDDDAQASLLWQQRLHPVRQGLCLCRIAQVAHQDCAQGVQGAACRQILQVAVEPLYGQRPTVHRRVVRDIAQYHGGHRRHRQSQRLQCRNGRVVSHPAIDHLRLHGDDIHR